MAINDYGEVSCRKPSGNTFSRAGVVLGQTSKRASCPLFWTLPLVYPQQGRQRVERGTYLCTDRELLNQCSNIFTVLSIAPNVQLSRYADPFQHPFKFHGLTSERDPAQLTFELLTRLSGAPGYGPPPAFGGFPGGSAPPGMGAPPGTGRPQSLHFDSVC